MHTFRQFYHLTETEEYWYRGANPTVDLVVLTTHEANVRVFLIRRGGVTEAGKWALPGGFMETPARKGDVWRPGAETPREASLREFHEETGIDLREMESQLVPIGVYERLGRDPRDTPTAWSRSYVFGVVLPATLVPPRGRARDDATAAQWFSLEKLPPLAFDHGEFIADAVRKLQPYRFI